MGWNGNEYTQGARACQGNMRPGAGPARPARPLLTGGRGRRYCITRARDAPPDEVRGTSPLTADTGVYILYYAREGRAPDAPPTRREERERHDDDGHRGPRPRAGRVDRRGGP